jgi:hypothetical protein
MFGIDISLRSANTNEEQPWVYLTKSTQRNLAEVPPPPMGSRDSSDFSWFYTYMPALSLYGEWDVAKTPPGIHMLHTRIQRVNKMGEDVYEITMSWIKEEGAELE